MRIRTSVLLLLALLAVLPPSWPQRKKPQRKPDIEFFKVSSVRQEGKIHYEGDVKVTGEKPVNGLVLQVHFFESGGVLLSIQKIEVEEAMLNPGDEKHFSVQGNDVPRAVSFRMSATDRNGRDLSTAGTGPFPLD